MKTTTRDTPVMSMTGASDDDLIFSVDGVALQAASDSVDTVAQWPVAVPSASDLSPVGRKVLAAAQRIAFLNPSVALDLKALAVRLAAELPAVRFVLRTASPKRPTGTVEDPSWALKALRHTLLVAHTEDGEELLIEPSFRAHFALPRASDTYLEALAAVPELLVVPPQTMRSLVQQLAARLAAETALTGRSLPPWRTAPALLSKWLPVSYVDTAVLAPPQPQPAAYPAYPVSSYALTSGMISPLSSSSNVSSTQSPLSLSPDSVLPYQPVLTRATDLLLNKLAPVQQQQAQAAPPPAVVVVGFAVRAEKPVEATAAASVPVVAPITPVAMPATVTSAVASAPTPTPAPTPAAVSGDVLAAVPDVAPAAAGTTLPLPGVPRTVSAPAIAPVIIPQTVPATTTKAAPVTPRNVSRSTGAAAKLVAAVAASSGATPSSVADVAAAAAAAVAAAKQPEPAGAGGGGGIMQMLQQQLLPSSNSPSGAAAGTTGDTGAGSLASRRFGFLSKVSSVGCKGETATAVAKVAPAAVTKVAGVPRKSKLQAVYQMLLPPVHTVKFAGAPANWEEIKAAASPHLALGLM